MRGLPVLLCRADMVLNEVVLWGHGWGKYEKGENEKQENENEEDEEDKKNGDEAKGEDEE